MSQGEAIVDENAQIDEKVTDKVVDAGEEPATEPEAQGGETGPTDDDQEKPEAAAAAEGISDETKDAEAAEDDKVLEVQSHEHIDFVTLGMFIVDDIDFPEPEPSVKDVFGGAGSYSALGARLFSPPPLSRTVGWVVDQGSDFPPAIGATIDSWATSAVLREDSSRFTTRGWNGYEGGADQRRFFRYTTPKKRLTAEDLTPDLLLARSFHLICSPLRCQQLVADIKARRRELPPREDGGSEPRPIFIWEPVPDLCTPDELLNCTNTLPVVDVCSPNHSELAGFMGDHGLDPETGEVSTAAVERACEQLLASMPLQSFSLVVRAGPKGCYIARNGGRKRQDHAGGSSSTSKRRNKRACHRGGLQPDTDMMALFAELLQEQEDGVVIPREELLEVDPGVEKWIPAYHSESSPKVVDPTGGGNAFLGGLAVALARGRSLEDAATWASVAASFAIEQIGMPTLTPAAVVNGDGDGDEDKPSSPERWNGVVVDDRLGEFQARL